MDTLFYPIRIILRLQRMVKANHGRVRVSFWGQMGRGGVLLRGVSEKIGFF